jgi:iron complex transport system substrate-binding protein
MFCVLRIFNAECGPEGDGNIQVIDFSGKNVSLSRPASRVVCLIESALSGVYMLGTQNAVVGISMNIYGPEVFRQYAVLDERIKNKRLPAPGNWDFVNIESVVALRPDLVIIWTSQTEAIDNIRSHGIPVYGVMLKGLGDIYKEMTDFGVFFGKQARADSLIAYTKGEIAALTSREPGTGKKKIYFMWAQGILETSGMQSTVNELIELSGATNACRLEQEHVIVNAETLLSWDPDAVVMWHNEKADPETVEKEPLLLGLRAVKNKMVFELPSVFYCDLWTLKFPYAVKMLAKWTYPGIYGPMNLERERHSMLRTLYGGAAENMP